MSTRVQVILELEEKEHFQRQAEAEGLSLSAWLRKAGESLLAGAENTRVPRSPQALKAFFETCRTREAAAAEQEADWEEHLRTIEISRSSGQAPT